MLMVARDALAALSRVDDVAGEIAAGASGTLRLGTTEGVREQLHLILERFHERHPDVEVRLLAMRMNEKVHGLLDGELDAALVRAARQIGADILELWHERLVAVLSRRHPLATRERLSVAELAPYPILLSPRERNPWAREKVEEIFAAADAELVMGPDYGSLREAVAMIAGSQAWMVARESVAAQERSALLVSLPLTDPTAVGHVSLAWRGRTRARSRARVPVVSALRREGSFDLRRSPNLIARSRRRACRSLAPVGPWSASDHGDQGDQGEPR